MTARWAMAVAVLAACGGDDGRGSLSIQLSLQEFTCLECFSPDECPLDCGGSIGIYVVDADTDELIDGECLLWNFQQGMLLRQLSGLLEGADLADGLVAGRRVVIEVAALYTQRSADGVADLTCPRVRQDPFGQPTTDEGELPAYFGRSQPIELDGSRAELEVEVPLQCVFVQQCTSPPNITEVTATVTDVIGLGGPQNPEMLDVHLGQVVLPFDPSGGPLRAVFSFVYDLDLLDGYTWHRQLDQMAFFDPFCTGTIVSRLGPDFTAPTASCQGFQDGVSFIDAQAYFLDKAPMNQVLDALGMANFPGTGLVIGQVVGADGLPAMDVVVTPQTADSDATAVYFDGTLVDDTLAIKPTAGTSANGLFAITTLEVNASWMGIEGFTATCCDYFDARRAADGAFGYSWGRLGLIDGVAMGAVIWIDGQSSPGVPGPAAGGDSSTR